MSTHDVNGKETLAEANHEASNISTDKSSSDGSGGFIILFFIIGLAASLILGWVIFPQFLYSQKNQPIDFNHALHMEEVDDGCASCHYFREDGSFSGAPKLAECIGCHEEPLGEDPEEIKFYEEYVAKEREVPWFIYARQPDCVFFSHSAHVNMGKMDCVTCHGNIGESESLRVYQENRLSGYSRDIWGHNIAGIKRNTWDRMKMDDCADCHEVQTGRRTSVQTNYDACYVCHK
jgi:hypothetical protein